MPSNQKSFPLFIIAARHQIVIAQKKDPQTGEGEPQLI